MVVVLVVLVWIAVLGVTAYRRLSERQADTSVQRFRTQTRTLRRVQPLMTSSDESNESSVEVQRTPRRPADQSFSSRERVSVRQARRRRTLTILGSTIVGTLVFGAVPALRIFWDLTIVAVLCTAGYVALLVHFGRLNSMQSERARKVVRFPIAQPGAELDTPRAAAMGGSSPVREQRFRPVRPAFVLVKGPS